MKREIPFTNKRDLKKLLQIKDNYILFGAGNIAEKTHRLIQDCNLLAIVDNSKNLEGEYQLGVEVISPGKLKSKKYQNSIIIITTTSFAEVTYQLENLGLKNTEDFIVSPILNDLRIIDELENIEKKLLFTSGSPQQTNPNYGGGTYELNIQNDKWIHKKIINGNCYGITKFKENYVVLDTDAGVIEFDQNYKIIRKKELPKGSRAHGIDYSPDYNMFIINCSYLDCILFLNEEFEIIDKITISKKHLKNGKPAHHINDCCVWNNSIYISMFSKTGNWKLDIFDGAILEYDIDTKEIIGSVIANLWMPHNIKIINGSITVLDSLKGHLLTNNAQITGVFPAFTRGLDHDGSFYYIGQSRNRNYSKNIGLSKNISIDTGIIIFDEYTKVSRFLQLPSKLSEIHSILVID